MENEKWSEMVAKVALAVAIIRCKPNGKSSRRYAEELAKHVSSHDAKMKNKVLELEAEVLSLRQERLLHKIHSKSNFEHEYIGLASEPLEDSRSTSQLEDDSGCDISNEDGVDKLTVCQSSNNCDLPLTSLSSFASPSNPLPIKKCITVGKGQLSSQIDFLNHLLGLRKLATVGGHLTNLTEFGNDSGIVPESVSGLLNGLLSLYKNPNPSVSKFQTEAIRTVTNLISDSHLSKNILRECMKRLETFEKSILQIILTNSQINRFQNQQAMLDCLYQLGKCSKVNGPLIHLLFSEIKNFVDELLQHQGQENYDITKYENIPLVCSLLENLLQHIKEQEILHSETFNDGTKLVVNSLYHTVLQISDSFPLLSIILWRLTTLFSCRGTEDS
ncbi:meiosis-specific protein MEI4 [Rana temporaria]|uniref:meiosis-specific protein MEI4 n=1 Tax=Rana temporaria TaxID=8407 RepID=UPI001AAC6618|nr:meiosis-specific protein MEI4 [Rana temporaria]